MFEKIYGKSNLDKMIICVHVFYYIASLIFMKYIWKDTMLSIATHTFMLNIHV